ncbi:D-alanyl-D-alanine carboxypeptidase/D-alanyl-D-alanine endopeptidase [Planococcus lenghuensis]|uniref:D-alanyl-D-alanine carboxypeptidase/D-alanyl-D-alanine endopeptidase n=1 Tax=Planococcus lenghuensis TaxID=2213202 RepID=UPI0038CDC874
MIWYDFFRKRKGADELFTEKEGRYSGLAGKLNRIIADNRLMGALAGVSIRKADTGEKIYDHYGEMRLRPASNMKLFSGAAALEILGENYRFTTEIHTDGTLEEGVLNGSLYLIGKGDPTLVEGDFRTFAIELKKQGIRRVNGDLIGDDTWFDAVRLSSGITWTDETYYYGSQISALTASPNSDYDAGSVLVEVHPGKEEGAAAQVMLSPSTDYVSVTNRAITAGADEPNSIEILRVHGTNEITVTGSIPSGTEKAREWISVWEPAGYALRLFYQALAAEGIEINGLRMGKVPADTALLTDRQSMPLRELLIPFMKLSNNGHAEILTKEMGRKVHGEGSWDAGLRVIEEVAATLGVNTATIQLRDGSGMSHANMIPANEISQLLFAVQAKPWYEAFLASLPIAGAEERFVGGTLRDRLTDGAANGNVQAKTGTLTSVSTLSGYVTAKSGERLIFSVLVNNLLEDEKTTEDAIAAAIAEYGE